MLHQVTCQSVSTHRRVYLGMIYRQITIVLNAVFQMAYDLPIFLNKEHAFSCRFFLLDPVLHGLFCEDSVNDPVFHGLIGVHPVISVEILDDPIIILVAVFCKDTGTHVLDLKDLGCLDLNI